ncbi:rhamnulokinase [Murinocardiopsis flavida]|uniref:Rhamnulokinase n=1 Tax=Murinocardiopsis flavida TaxID=645275 RepID=A0A2P8DFK0_9ACTN|nr:rhamnulokinase family protein [Murinocardiopsis flavida]PSK95967.1 rhamnulokinase [Murinocardiopsis flavida]
MTTRPDGIFAAVDLGASSGRVVVGRVGPGTLDPTEVHRFANEPVRLPSGLHWDVLGLYREVLRGLSAAAAHGPESVGIDSWAVDYGLLDADGALIGAPFHYRDTRTDTAARAVVAQIGATELYAANGLQYLPFNTIFQLAASRGTSAVRGARTLLLIPDLLGYWLTGERGAEITNASTTGLLDVAGRRWSAELAETVRLPRGLLPDLREPGDTVGPLLAEPRRATGLDGVPVVAVASHDTASAVLGVPAETAHFGYLSCGTWSLAGVELDAPVRTEAARAANFTNELGAEGTTRFLRNIMGLWLVQESLRTWGVEAGALPGLLAEAERAEPFAAVIDPDDPRFLPPGDMPARIAEFLRETGQRPPATRAALLRCVLESLALAHRSAIRSAARLSGHRVDVVHLVGGGARNTLLCQMTADALGLPVLAGPVEATAIGNLLVQARAAGQVGDRWAARGLVADAHRPRRFEPAGDARAWDAAARRIAAG